jgi:hypothetical protein
MGGARVVKGTASSFYHIKAGGPCEDVMPRSLVERY